MSELKTRPQKKAKKKRSLMRTINWGVCTFLFLFILVYGINIGTIVSTLVAILAMPIEPIQNLWKTLFKGKSLSLVKGLILFAMFVFACTLMPDSETDAPNRSEIASEENIDVEQNKEELNIIINDENEVADAEQEVEKEETSDQNMTPEKEDSSSSVVFDSESFSPSNSTSTDLNTALPNKDMTSSPSNNDSTNTPPNNDSSNTSSNTTSNNTPSNDGTSNNTTSNNTSSDTSSVKQENSSSSVTIPTPDTGENLVWVPVNGGERYHTKSTCSKMIDPIQVTKENAIANGYTPCGKCYK